MSFSSLPRGEFIHELLKSGDSFEAEERVDTWFYSSFFLFFSLPEQKRTEFIPTFFQTLCDDLEVIRLCMNDTPNGMLHLFCIVEYVISKNIYSGFDRNALIDSVGLIMMESQPPFFMGLLNQLYYSRGLTEDNFDISIQGVFDRNPSYFNSVNESLSRVTGIEDVLVTLEEGVTQSLLMGYISFDDNEYRDFCEICRNLSSLDQKIEFFNAFSALGDTLLVSRTILDAFLFQEMSVPLRQSIGTAFAEICTLPEGFIENIQLDVDIYSPEIESHEAMYFPVGVSSNLKKWEEYAEGKNSIAKPLDIITWLLWCENQGVDSSILICDDMQTSNYAMQSNSDFSDIFPVIRNFEYGFYSSCVQHMGCEHVKIDTYDAIASDELFQRYEVIFDVLENHPILQSGFDKLSHPLAGKGDVNSNESQVRKYALTEICWIIAQRQKKVTHLNEAKLGYDPLAFIIIALQYNLSEEEWDDDEKVHAMLGKILNTFDQGVSQRISSSNGMQKKYWQACKNFILGEKKGKKYVSRPAFFDPKQGRYGSIPEDLLPWDLFHCPNSITSQSFGVASGSAQPVSSFKEPYSTVFSEDEKFSINDFVQTSQIPVFPDFSIYLSFFGTLSAGKQKKYLYEVLYPLVREYLVFVKGKDVAEYITLLSDLRKRSTLLGVMEFIYQNIIYKYSLAESLSHFDLESL